MKRMKLSETKIIAMLKEGASGIEVEELCRNYAISASTFYTLKAQYGGMEISHLKRLKELEHENSRLKRNRPSNYTLKLSNKINRCYFRKATFELRQ